MGKAVYKRALALDDRTYHELLEGGFMPFFHDRAINNMYRRVTAHRKKYMVFFWDWEETPDKWDELLKSLEHRRHALLEIDQDGKLTEDYETEDEFGSDIAFEGILGCKSVIVLWNDPAQLLV